MYFKEALEDMKYGWRIRRKNWGGYWSYSDTDGLRIHLKTGEVLDQHSLDINETISHTIFDDWERVGLQETTVHDIAVKTKDYNMLEEHQLQLELEAKGLTAPRVTPEDLDDFIESATYTRMPSGTTTVCELVLRNGFSVRGESSCVSPENFDAKIGRDISYKAARDKLWLLLGFKLQDELYNAQHPDVDSIAKVCHEVNRAYCAAMGDHSQPEWSKAPAWQRRSAVNGVQYHLDNPDATPEDSHKSWMDEKFKDGWSWGPQKHTAMRRHPCMVPYEHLPADQQAKDRMFRAIVHAMSKGD